MGTKTLERITQVELKIMLELHVSKDTDFLNQEFEVIAREVSKTFDVDCTVEDLDEYYSD